MREVIMNKRLNRRTFLKNSLIAATGIGLASTVNKDLFAKSLAWLSDPVSNPMPKQPLGNTGYDVGIYSLGGQGALEVPGTFDKSVAIINRALDLGVNYIDTAAYYGSGSSEMYIGEVMKTRRDEVFLATKSHDYTYDGTMRLIEESLRRLNTDYLDLYQHHYMFQERYDRLLKKDSARHAFEKLREEGIIRNIGVTGHSARILSDAIENYDYDCVLIPLNAAGSILQDEGNLDRFFQLTSQKNMGVIAMKVFGGGGLIGRGLTPKQLLYYTMSQPVSTTIVGISQMEHLEENVRNAKQFKPLTDEEIMELKAVVQ
jgi:aryl-alcohol dehydrogenase-like predicted oxidoreductase